tara:strand:- start:23 stop:301 length:279 start_codon:yes stop_codon:yes gene_type:complete
MVKELSTELDHDIPLYEEYMPVDVVAEIFCNFGYSGKYEGDEELAEKVRIGLVQEFADKLKGMKFHSGQECKYCSDNLYDRFIVACGADNDI